MMNNFSLSKQFYRYDNVKQESIGFYLGFLVWPFGILLAAFKYWRRPWAKNVFWLFCVFFGSTFIISELGGADSDRYARLFIQYAHSDMSLSELWNSFYMLGSDYIDIASPLITYIVSRFTDNPNVLFTVFGFIFGFFYSRNIWSIMQRVEWKIPFIAAIYLFTFAIINPIWNINGFRMWTAAQIFLYGCLGYFFDGNNRRLAFAFVAIFFHFSFILPLIILIGYVFVKNRLTPYYVVFLITFFMKEIDLTIMQAYVDYLPGILRAKVTNYTNPEYAESISLMQQSLNWYVTFSNTVLTYVVLITVSTVYFFYKKQLEDNKELMRLLCYSLLLYSFANVFSFIPSMGRFHTVANTFMFAFMAIFLANQYKNNAIQLIQFVCIPLIGLFAIVNLRSGMDYFGFLTVIGNPFSVALVTDSQPLIDIIKRLL